MGNDCKLISGVAVPPRWRRMRLTLSLAEKHTGIGVINERVDVVPLKVSGLRPLKQLCLKVSSQDV